MTSDSRQPDRAVGVIGILLANAGQELFAQRQDALRDGVGVLILVDGTLGGFLDRRRHREVGLADAEVDRVLEGGAQFEDLADAGSIDGV